MATIKKRIEGALADLQLADNETERLAILKKPQTADAQMCELLNLIITLAKKLGGTE